MATYRYSLPLPRFADIELEYLDVHNRMRRMRAERKLECTTTTEAAPGGNGQKPAGNSETMQSKTQKLA